MPTGQSGRLSSPGRLARSSAVAHQAGLTWRPERSAQPARAAVRWKPAAVSGLPAGGGATRRLHFKLKHNVTGRRGTVRTRCDRTVVPVQMIRPPYQFFPAEDDVPALPRACYVPEAGRNMGHFSLQTAGRRNWTRPRLQPVGRPGWRNTGVGLGGVVPV